MKARSGQAVLYLVAVLVALCVLAVMNVSVYLAVTAKNRAMNAGDAAALAVANYQGQLLNRIGQMNIDHLLAALDNDEKTCKELMQKQLRASFLGPISGKDADLTELYGAMTAANEAAKKNGASAPKWWKEQLAKHVQEIRDYYEANPESYPQPWEGAWKEYAQIMEVVTQEDIFAFPANINFIDEAKGHLLLEQQFYNAVAGRSWCWFKFHAPDLLANYRGVQDWGPLPYSDLETRLRRCVNSEIYSLNLRLRIGSAVTLLGTNLICRLTDKTPEDIAKSYLITNAVQEWMFYDDSTWRTWTEIDPYGVCQFPVVGRVRPEYNVRGCAALCGVVTGGRDPLAENVDKKEERVINDYSWTAGAKPFGTVQNEEDQLDVVTAFRDFVTPAFSQTHLVPIDAIGGADTNMAAPDWLDHIREHVPLYLQEGVSAISLKSCWYCQQLVSWEHDSFRKAGNRWLKYHSSECVRDTGSGTWQGGTPHGH